MIRTQRERVRDERKHNIIKSFVGHDKLFTNEIAKKINVVWPVADRLLIELVDEKRLAGDKVNGYYIYQEDTTLLAKLKKLYRRK